MQTNSANIIAVKNKMFLISIDYYSAQKVE